MLPREEKIGREDRVIEVVAMGEAEEEVLVESDLMTRMVMGMKNKATEGEVVSSFGTKLLCCNSI